MMPDMVSAADTVLAALNDSSLWVVRPGVNVFDEHAESRPNGSPEVFDKARLERLAANSNRRDAQGQPCPLTLGHTKDGAAETEQPPIVGYARQFRVEWDTRLGKWVIRANYYLRRDQAALAEQYPRTSVERWPGSDFFDPIALLKVTPRLDLGQWTYSRPNGRVCYSMEASMPDFGVPPATGTPPATPPAPPAANPAEDEYAKFCGHMKRYEAERAKPPEAPGDPTKPPQLPPVNGSAVAPPKPSESEAERMQRHSEALRYARLEQEMAALKYQAALATSERVVAQLEFEGYRIPSRAAEVERMARLDDAGRTAREQEIRTCYQKAPVGPGRGASHDFVQTANAAGPGGPKQMSREQMESAQRYAREKGCSWEEAVKHEMGTGA